ncbi:VOC family protein [Nocardia cyriacigeorgica]|uniref:VOC family protein n=1 Tax=Nocardia cyriacigeorgica TaxID=135487 RepID=UPI002456A782|nr:VOC family protein [Nocardia cyriacigeorgica]
MRGSLSNATDTDPRIAVLDVGADDHLMIIETAGGAQTGLDPLGRAGWGLRVGTHAQLLETRERLLAAGRPTGAIEILPTQWTMTCSDPDDRPVDIRAHRPRTHSVTGDSETEAAGDSPSE